VSRFRLRPFWRPFLIELTDLHTKSRAIITTKEMASAVPIADFLLRDHPSLPRPPLDVRRVAREHESSGKLKDQTATFPANPSASSFGPKVPPTARPCHTDGPRRESWWGDPLGGGTIYA